MISYEPLTRTMKERNVKKSNLRYDLHISSKTISKIEKGEPLSLSTVERLCMYLDCEIQDVVRIAREQEV